MLAPVEPEPADVVFNRLDIFGIFGQRVRIVEAKVAPPAVILGQAEVEADRLGVPDVQIAVGLGREPGDHRGPIFTGGQIGIDDGADEIS